MTDIFEDERRRLFSIIGIIQSEADGIEIDRSSLAEKIYRERKFMREELPTLILSREDANALALQNSFISHSEKTLSDAEARLDVLLRMIKSPYFGRIDFTEQNGERHIVYVGLSNLADSDYTPIVCDWRAPVCSLFYEQGRGKTFYSSPEGIINVDVTLIRQFRITDGTLEFLIDSDLKIDDTVLLSALAHNATTYMRTIAATIQREQNSVIRNADSELLIVLGPAGSGKTNIALHRVAYLLYRDREKLKSSNILILSPNKIFSEYISHVVPELGEREIPCVTFRDVINRFCGVRVRDYLEQFEFLCSSDESEAAVLRRYFINALNNPMFTDFVNGYVFDYTPDFCDVVFNGSMIYSSRELHEMFKVRFSHLRIVSRLEAIENEITLKLAPHKKAYRDEIAKTLGHIYTDEDQLRIKTRLAFDEAANTTLEDISHNISVNWPSVCRQVIIRYIEKQNVNSEIYGVLLRNIPLFAPDEIFNYEDGTLLLLIKVLFGDISSPRSVRHVVIDEIQDYSLCAHVSLGKLFSHCRLTLLGDISQTLNPGAGISSADDIRRLYPHSSAGIKNLSKSYRNTVEISSFVSGILSQSCDFSVFERHGKEVSFIVRPSARELIHDLAHLLPSCDKSFITAVITKTRYECRLVYQRLKQLLPEITLVDSDDNTYEKGVIVIPLALAKGLEFDRVFISDSSVYVSDYDRMPLYTACTRAMHELTVCGIGCLSPLIHSKQ